MKNLEFFLWSILDFKVILVGGEWVFRGPSKIPGSISNTWCVWDDASKIDQTSVHNKMDCLFPHLTVLSLSLSPLWKKYVVFGTYLEKII